MNIVLHFFQNIWAGTRFVLFLPTPLWQFKYGFVQLCLLLALSFLLPFTYDYVDSYPDNVFNIYGLTYQATLYLLFFLSVGIIARVENDLASMINIMIIFLSFAPAVWGVYLFVDWLADKQTWFEKVNVKWAIFYAYLAWYLSIIFRSIRRYYHENVITALWLIVIYGLINYVPLIFYLPQQPLWYPDFTSSMGQSTSEERLNIEDTYYDQPALVRRITDRLLPERPGKTDMYFIGLAGYADEDVFMNEARLAKELFDERFDTQGRSLLLVNNKKTVNDLPLANRHNLASSINAIAETMNLEEDILFIMMTSHGSEEHELSIEFDLLGMKDINPKEIKTMLDIAGIKSRVIVISACYSGGFIAPLFNEDTLIMTASDKDKKSFGCGHHGSYTYFGEAMFGEHLRSEHDFERAFAAAKKSIEAREQEESLDSSSPQIKMGKNIKEKLAQFTSHLQ